MEFNDVIGKVVDSINLDKNKDRITFKFQDGTERSYSTEGDCCSQSWIEHLEMPNDVQGAMLLSVEDSDGVPWDNHTCEKDECDENYAVIKDGCGHDSLAVYNTKFRTTKGDIVLEYRNDSNGYYGGYLIGG